MTTGRRTAPEMTSAIARLAAEGHGAAEIERRLERQMPDATLPDIRTIQRYVREARIGDSEEAWSVTPDSQASPFVLLTLAEVIQRTEGRVLHITNAIARWLET